MKRLLTIGSSLVLVGASSYAKADQMGVTRYFEAEASVGDSVCELVDPSTMAANCYVVLDFEKVLTPETDPSGFLKAGRISAKQGSFDQVKLHQLVSSVEADMVSEANIINIYIKLNWKGRRAGPMDVALAGEHIVKGQMKLNEKNEFVFELSSIPDLLIFGTFMPSMDVAEMFGRNAEKESFELEHEVKLWADRVVGSVLPAYFNQLKAHGKKISISPR